MPSFVTMLYAMLQAFQRSSQAPVVTSLKKCCSAHRPPRMKQIRSSNYSVVCSWFSLMKYCANPRAPFDLGMIVTFKRGSAPSRNQETTACPLSWQATVFFSFKLTNPLRSTPPMTRYEDSQKSSIQTCSFSHLAAKIAASLQRLASYAPLKPGVREAILLAYSQVEYFGERMTGLRWTRRIQQRPLRSGRPTSTYLSNLPGLTRALSRTSFRLVAAITMTLLLVPKPSISTSSWFSVLSRSSLDPILFCLFLPTASSSSMKMIDGACSVA